MGRWHQAMEFGDSLRAAEDREEWKGIVVTSSVVPRRPPRLRDWDEMSLDMDISHLRMTAWAFIRCVGNRGKLFMKLQVQNIWLCSYIILKKAVLPKRRDGSIFSFLSFNIREQFFWGLCRKVRQNDKPGYQRSYSQYIFNRLTVVRFGL